MSAFFENSTARRRQAGEGLSGLSKKIGKTKKRETVPSRKRSCSARIQACKNGGAANQEDRTTGGRGGAGKKKNRLGKNNDGWVLNNVRCRRDPAKTSVGRHLRATQERRYAKGKN